MRKWAISPTVAATLAVTAGCGSDAADTSTGTERPTTPATDAGWLDGEPTWTDTGGGEGGAPTGAADGAAPEIAADADASGSRSEIAVPAPPSDQGPLRAGNVDDNADFQGYLDYLARISSLGIPMREFDPTGRIVVTATGASGLPVAGAEIVVSADGAEVARLRTTADGTARFHPALYGTTATTFEFSAEGVTATAEAGGAATLALPSAGGATAPVPLDVLFLLDATGSMGDEIDRLKTSIDSVADRLSQLESAPDVRFAMTLYRDEGDTFVTATHDFTADVAAFRAALADVVADGGGDYPEALDEGLAEALAAPSWRDPASTVQLVFLVADAPPQVGRQVPTPYPAAIADAIGRGIKIFPVASSESDDQAEAVFRQIAQATGARFVFLSYGAGGAATGGSTDIDRTDYEELALDDLVVRLVGEELAALTGEPAEIPPPDSTTTTTIPEGQ